jgi:hypothetical protein
VGITDEAVPANNTNPFFLCHFKRLVKCHTFFSSVTLFVTLYLLNPIQSPIKLIPQSPLPKHNPQQGKQR